MRPSLDGVRRYGGASAPRRRCDGTSAPWRRATVRSPPGGGAACGGGRFVKRPYVSISNLPSASRARREISAFLFRLPFTR